MDMVMCSGKASLNGAVNCSSCGVMAHLTGTSRTHFFCDLSCLANNK